MSAITLPTKRKRGGQSPETAIIYDAGLQSFSKDLERIDSTLDFKVCGRGWCYLLEGENLIDKSQFDYVEKLIVDCRKIGYLPLSFCLEDSSRVFHNVESIDYPLDKQIGFVESVVESMLKTYKPYSLWNNQKYYVQMVVEKVDLRSLFNKLCEDYCIPIANGKGWSDIDLRGKMINRFKANEENGRIPVLLYCGDFDPGGFHISKFLKSNICELEAATGWRPDNLIIDRFGLNFDFIQNNKLIWIENLVTSSKEKKDLNDPKNEEHYKDYVQSYLEKYCELDIDSDGLPKTYRNESISKKDKSKGNVDEKIYLKRKPRKVEANALLKVPEIARSLCKEAILKYVNQDKVNEYHKEMDEIRSKLRAGVNSRLDMRSNERQAQKEEGLEDAA